MTNEREQKPLVWSTAHTLSNDDSGLAINIQATDEYWPRYSLELGRLNRNGKFTRFHPVIVRTANAKCKLETVINAEQFTAIIYEANQWILKTVQALTDKRLEERIAKEQAGLDRDKPKPQAGLKTLSRKDAEVKAQPALGTGKN